MITDYGKNQKRNHAKKKNNQLLMNLCAKANLNSKIYDNLIEDVNAICCLSKVI